LGNYVVVIVRAALTAIDRAFVADCPKASVTFTVKFELPVVVGVPDMVPVALRVRFAGSDPLERLQTSVPTPPVACNVSLYGKPTVPPGSEVVVIVGGIAGLMMIERPCVTVWPLASFTSTVNDEVPVTIGVPEMTPVAGFRLRFCGREPVAMLHINGPLPPVACTDWLYVWPTFPLGSEVVVIASGGGGGLIVKERLFSTV
jgi:hypothetical protein